MAGLNKVLLIGNLGRDPEVRYTTGGTPVANLALATSEQWNDPSSGERKERTEWHRIVVFGKQAEIANQYLRKGKQIFVEGSLQTREWTDRDGNKRYTTEIRAQRFQMLGRVGDVSGADREQEQEQEQEREQEREGASTVADGGPGYAEDDIPF